MSEHHHHMLEEVPGGERELELEIKHDYSSSHDGIVPLSVRRGTWSHHVPLWVTLYAGFSYMALGSELYSFGYKLSQMLTVVLVSTVCYLAYSIPAAYLGAVKGQTHALMGRSVFGLTGSMIVSVFVLVAPLGWVGYQANTLAIMWNSLFNWTPVLWLGVAIAVLGITNNVLGFTGITAFARWIAAPVTVVWVLWMVIKAFATTDSAVLHSSMPGTPVSPLTLGIIAALGFATYGNEPDLFRYAKPQMKATVPPLFFGLLVGQILFPLAGWILAARVQSPDFGKGFSEAVTFSLFGFSFLAFLLATATQVAVNDANYYESLNAGQNLFGGWAKWRRFYTCIVIAIGGGFMAWWVPQNSANFFRVTTWLAVSIPTATVIMYMDQLLLPKIFKGYDRNMSKVPAWDQVAKGNWPGIVSLLVAVCFGAYGSGVFPGQSGYPLDGWGIVPVEAWIIAAVLYTILVGLTWRLPNGKAILGFPKTALESEQAAATSASL
ncbi:MAG: cytosine permease [Actinomycetes bacterium]